MNAILIFWPLLFSCLGAPQDQLSAHRALLEEAAPIAIEETIVITVREGTSSERTDPVVLHIERSADGRVRLDVRELVVFIDDRFLSVIDERNDRAFLRIAHEGRPRTLLAALFADLPSVWLQLVLGAQGNVEPLQALHPALAELQPLPESSPPAYRSPDARVVVSEVLPGRVQFAIESGRWVEPGAQIEWTITSRPTTARGTEFEPGERLRVDHLAMLAPGAMQPTAAGQKAPPLDLPMLDGGRFDPAEHAGRILVLDFWASWCQPCRAALPRLDAFARGLRAQGLPVTVLTVNTSERATDPAARREVVAAARDAIGFDLPILLAGSGVASSQWGVTALPTTIVVGPDGRIAWMHRGAGPEYLDQLEDAIDALLPPE